MPEHIKKSKPPSAKRKTRIKKTSVVTPSRREKISHEEELTIRPEISQEPSENLKTEPLETVSEAGKSKHTGKYFYAVGRRKTAMAKVRLYEDDGGKFKVNTLDFTRYFPTKELQRIIFAPVSLLGLEKSVRAQAYVSGGGNHAQAEAVRHALAQTLIMRNPEDRPALKKMGFLTRDPRVKERKKPGLKRARRAPQWSKR